MPKLHTHREDLAKRVQEEGWVKGHHVIGEVDEELTPDQAREIGWKYLLAADIAEGHGPEEHGGPHINEFSITTLRPLYLLTGLPVGRTQVHVNVEYEDPVCADQAVETISALLKLRDWWAP